MVVSIVRTKIFICYLLLITVCSCDSKTIFDKYTSVNSHWAIDQPIIYKFYISDSIQPMSLFLKIRTNEDYLYSNLFLIVNLEYPNGKKQLDTLEYKMSNSDGTMLGQGLVSIKEHKLWFKGHQDIFRFSEKGNYSIAIKHAVRELGKTQGVKFLDGIEDVGFSIEMIE